MFLRRGAAITTMAILLSFSLLPSCSQKPPPRPPVARQAPPAPDYWPTSGWRFSTPEARGMDSALLADAMRYIIENRIGLHSFMIVKSGYAVLDAYFHPFEKGSLHDIASCTKSITSTLVGIAIDRGYLKGAGQKISEIFPIEADMLKGEAKQSLTIADLLTMSSGLDCLKNGSDVMTNLEMMASPDWARFALDLPLAGKPGERFEYCSANCMILSASVHASSGLRADEFAKKLLFGPIGIGEFTWATDPANLNTQGGGDMLLAPHDMARFGFLFLHGGSWDGAQIVSGKWVSEATSPKMKVRGMGLIDGYGYNWWIGSGGFYLAIGRGGQWILIIPQYDMVIVMTGNSGSEGKVREKIIREFVLPAVMSDKAIPENPAAAQALSDLAGAAAAGSDVRLVTRVSDSPVAGEISGKTFILEKNVLGIDWLKIVFAPGSSTAELVFHRDGTGTSELSVGLDGIARRSAGRYGLPVFTRGAWISDSEFEIEMDEVANINRWKITARWDESGLRAEFKNLDGLPPVTLKGTPGM